MGSDDLPIIANFHTIGKRKRDDNIQEENQSKFYFNKAD